MESRRTSTAKVDRFPKIQPGRTAPLKVGARASSGAAAGSDPIPPAPAIPNIPAALLGDIRSLFLDSGYASALEQRSSRASKEQTGADPRLGPLKRLFAGARTLRMQEAACAVAPLELRALIEAGLLEQQGDQVRARYQLQVYDGLLFIVDFMPLQHPPEIVLPIGPSGRYLASVTSRKGVRSALDLGCGCGIQALLLARHAESVTATDINPRAVALTRINACLNGISNVEILEGSYFEPVRGRTFDLIVANLPYVITPENRYTYRDLGRGDDVPIRQNVQQMEAHLNEGGYAHLLLNWIHQENEPWWQPVDQWLEKCRAEAWLFHSSSMGPEEYARRWILIDGKAHPEEFEAVKKKWMEWYRAQHIERIAFGLITLRRSEARDHWRCFLNVNQVLHEGLGDYIQSLFEIQDYLSQFKRWAELAPQRLARWNITIKTSEPNVQEAQTIKGYLLRMRVGPVSRAAINRLDGKISLTQAIRRSAQEAGLDSPALREQVTREIYQLMNLGMIGPSQGAGT